MMMSKVLMAVFYWLIINSRRNGAKQAIVFPTLPTIQTLLITRPYSAPCLQSWGATSQPVNGALPPLRRLISWRELGI
ncbi:hypothetical protein ASPACDRAFT_1904514 [Aspergillus aculeatus ATCC 16872]|uniref:Secreted protein n=1 Tax=Aspergillus aculeatus (strain ATCC 16872 / CBS 172.66 / WB 5094) TaxID=690307 RepID=A0A1L9WNG6_ASPA1|nr:uncharacterized protein ASPACDRAFT_1904514 [Aspergillus aculeatus ATCC 16872]OJJ97703.1 hypothetical protein ASPACDRAFT_1904514 [Aspergillus aculeatus ATCC 16872]